MINLDNVATALLRFRGQKPFDHCVIDDFFVPDWAARLESEFPAYDSPEWYVYDNAIEHKRALNDWNRYPATTYQTLVYLSSDAFVRGTLGGTLGIDIRPDPGLHGGGWHMHGCGGNLNPHMDYHLHPKMHAVRKLNLIVYLSSSLEPTKHGGHFGLWAHNADDDCPGHLVREIAPQFNRAVLFDTTQNSWHGMSQQLAVPAGIYRKSLAIYYMTGARPSDLTARQRALFAPRADQADDPDVAELIRRRAHPDLHKEVYRQIGSSRNE